MGGSAHHGNAVRKSGERVASAGATADPGGARSEGAGFRGVCAARAELHDGASGGGGGTARGFGGDQGLEGDGGEQIGFRNLGFDDGGANGEDRFAGEENGAFGGGEEVAGETEIAQVVEEGRADAGELREAAEVVDLLGGEAEVEEVVDNLGDAGDDDIIAVRGQAAEGEFEGGFLGDLAGLEVSGGHGELV